VQFVDIALRPSGKAARYPPRSLIPVATALFAQCGAVMIDVDYAGEPASFADYGGKRSRGRAAFLWQTPTPELDAVSEGPSHHPALFFGPAGRRPRRSPRGLSRRLVPSAWEISHDPNVDPAPRRPVPGGAGVVLIRSPTAISAFRALSIEAQAFAATRPATLLVLSNPGLDHDAQFLSSFLCDL